MPLLLPPSVTGNMSCVFSDVPSSPQDACEAETVHLPVCCDTPGAFTCQWDGYFQAVCEKQTGTANTSDPFSQYPLTPRVCPKPDITIFSDTTTPRYIKSNYISRLQITFFS